MSTVTKTLLSAFFLSALAFAQVDRGNVQGVVTDSTGLALVSFEEELHPPRPYQRPAHVVGVVAKR